MKKVLVLLGGSALFLASCVDNPEGKKAETTDSTKVAAISGAQLMVDTTLSSLAWTARKVSATHNGDVKIKSGTIAISDGKLTGGNFTVDLTTLTNKDLEGEYKGKLEGHLKSPDFFDVANHPTAVFEITEVKPGTTPQQVVVSGNLTIRGVSKNITFDTNISEATENSFKAVADFNIAREDWGIVYTGKADDLISKEINLKINLAATK
ncbi:MAG: YceI family protein [Chitinophagaceae bacterium]|nr:YceI family protein [Chitinophagaceae bacterium]